MSTKIYYQHVRNGKLNYTVAYTVDRQPTLAHIKYAVAQCKSTDSFCRAVGREIATKRLIAGRDNSVYQSNVDVAANEGTRFGWVAAAHFEDQRAASMNKK